MNHLEAIQAAGVLVAIAATTLAAETIGKRPYEMEWANRTQDHCPPLVDFEDLTGWRVECQDGVATLERTREQQIWGEHVAKLTYRGTGGAPEVRLVPPGPIRIGQAFDAVTLWCYGNNWGWAPDPNTPQVSIAALFADANGKEFRVHLYHVDWTEWYLLHKRLAPEQIIQAKPGASFKGIAVTGGRNREDRVLYFDNLAVFIEKFPPLQFEARPRRGIPMFPGQSAGANTGPGRLPFPTRPETILPENLTRDFQTQVQAEGDTFVFAYTGSDGRLVYRLQPETGTWSDLTATWESAARDRAPPPTHARPVSIQPCVDGGVYLQTTGGPSPPDKSEHLGTKLDGEEVKSRWRVSAAGVSAEVAYTYRLWNKSLVIDVVAMGGAVGEVRYGRAVGLQDPRLVTHPFYPAEGGRPAVAVSGPPDAPLFVTGNTDWYLSNGSILWARNAVEENGVVYNGGTRYVPLTNGKRNDCYERFFVTIAPRFEEVLPVIPNPVSPWKHVTGTRLWRAHGASNRERDARFWTECHRWGMTQVVVTDHETGWRDGGESFTFRTRAAPGKGGDQGQYDYARLMQDQLGFVYGPYNNFTDFAPVNEFWSFDMVSRTPENQLQHAWMRCYAPKPARAVEYCARLAPEIERTFRFSTAYCDVHTAVAPWHRVDYDPRVPGAGAFAAVFYAFGEIMLHQKKAWDGPVYSEGNYHCFYAGLTDGNYGQDQSYRPAENPWLVDFDLRRMHDLGCNFGMGNPDMFFAGDRRWRDATNGAWLDRFLAATVAFGHPGFLTYEGGLAHALRSYYMLQQLHGRYCLTNVAEIRYAGADGVLLDTSRAVATGAYQRSQVVTRYADGTVTAVNGHRTERMAVEAYGRRLDLPPNGYAGWTRDGAIEVLSSDPGGHRFDYAATPAYLYVDGRGRFTRHQRAAGNGAGICRMLTNGQYEVLLYQGAECGFAVDAASAVALGQDRREMGPAQLRRARGLTYVIPVEGAFSYLLTPGRNGEGRIALTCDREEVFAGEQVRVRGREAHDLAIPADAEPGQRLWFEREGNWIDFAVVPLTDLRTTIEDNSLSVHLCSHAPRAEVFTVTFVPPGTSRPVSQTVRLEPRAAGCVKFELPDPQAEFADVFTVEVRLREMTQRLECGLGAAREMAPVISFPEKWTQGMCIRGQKETTDLGQTRTIVEPRRTSAGGVAKEGLFMHPPWQGGVGYAFARYEPVMLPARPAAAFRAVVGKGDGSDLGDGIHYQVAVVDEAGLETVVAETIVTRHDWLPTEADLSRWAGRRVALKLITDVGIRDNSSGDWGCWAELRIETLQPELHYSLEANPDLCRHEPGPSPLSGLTLEMLRTAKSGWLRYDGRGLEGSGEYATHAVLNGVRLGEMKNAHGGERPGLFAKDVGVPLTPEAIRMLGRRNRFVLENPNRDYFTVSRFWIELELADGRKGSSDVSTATFTQPPEWPLGEGIGVPFGRSITVDIWFPEAR